MAQGTDRAGVSPADPWPAPDGAASSTHPHELCSGALQDFEQALASFQQALPPCGRYPALDGSGAFLEQAVSLADPLPADTWGPRRGVAEMAAWLAELTRELVALSSRLEDGLAALDSKRAAAEQHARGLQQQVEAMSGQLRQVCQQNSGLAADRGLQQQLEVMSGQLRQVLQQNVGFAAELEGLDGRLRSAQQRQDELGSLQRRVEVMSSQLQQVRQQSVGLAADRGLQQQVEAMSGQLRQVLQQNVGFAAELEGMDGELRGARQREEELSSRLLLLSQAQRQGHSDFHRLRREVDLMKKLGDEVRGRVLDDLSGLDRKLRADLQNLEADRQAAAAWEELGRPFAARSIFAHTFPAKGGEEPDIQLLAKRAPCDPAGKEVDHGADLRFCWMDEAIPHDRPATVNELRKLWEGVGSVTANLESLKAQLRSIGGI
ncbi:unnamed protein product [Prorocentrum cordatum]|uniref:Uncharacterized protein n=1 Tax=Prorocentrum cordatum TaxID=2364126 RepID=A0ABN9V0F7_9DINO|nr:unnamed protein product [Polarella glacialis]